MTRSLLLCVAALALWQVPIQARDTGFLNRTVDVDGVSYRYQVYVPASWNDSNKWPIVLFLHGAGERGDDGMVQTNIGIGGAIRRFVDRFPAVIVMPQCAKGVWWQDPKMEAQALAALAQATKEFNGDPDRTYLTGLSMGGYGTWALAAKYPERWAAIAPICGGIRRPVRPGVPPDPPLDPGVDPYAETAKKIGRIPAWVFHGGADPTVPVTESQNMVAALKAAGNDVKYTEYEGVGHNSWDKAYAEPDFPAWLFSQRLSARKVGP